MCLSAKYIYIFNYNNNSKMNTILAIMYLKNDE